jgi:tetratricopeptide (TPR) repeat protein
MLRGTIMRAKNAGVVIQAFCLGMILLFSPLVFAQSGVDHFNRGVKAAKAGNHREALTQFQAAKKLGLDTAALKYNLAVTYFQLEQYEEAEKVFTDLTKEPKFRQIAYFNLGLVANKQNHRTTAIKFFRLANQEGDSHNIRILAAEALQRLDAPLIKPAERKAWAGFLSVGFASDSNVTLVNNDLIGVTSQSDNYNYLSGFGAYWLQGGRNAGTRLFLDGYLQRYSKQTAYNFSLYGAGLARYDRLGDWRLRLGGFWDEVTLGGKSYQRLLSGELRGEKLLSKNTRLQLRYRASEIDELDPVYEYLIGSRQQFRVGTMTRQDNKRIRVYYQLEINNRKDLVRADNTFSSYSPTRHSLRITGWWDINKLWALRLDGRYRYSHYNDADVLTGGITRYREDGQLRLSAQLSRELGKNTKINLKYTAINSRSNIAKESYNRSLASVDISWSF